MFFFLHIFVFSTTIHGYIYAVIGHVLMFNYLHTDHIHFMNHPSCSYSCCLRSYGCYLERFVFPWGKSNMDIIEI